MKKVLNFLKLRYLYIYFLIYVIIDYFLKGKISDLGVFEFINSYFGITIFPLMIILLFSMLFPFINNQTKKMLLSVRLYCFFLLSISCILLYLMYILELPFEKIVADDKIIKHFLQLSLYKYKIGLVATYGFYLLLTNVMFMYIYIGLGIIIFCTTFLITAKCINRGIKKLYHEFKERRRIAREERLIREQIAIKEALEKREAMMKAKLEKEKENKIKEKVDEALTNDEVILKTYSEGEPITLDETSISDNKEDEILSEEAKNFNLFVINDSNKNEEINDTEKNLETAKIEEEIKTENSEEKNENIEKNEVSSDNEINIEEVKAEEEKITKKEEIEKEIVEENNQSENSQEKEENNSNNEVIEENIEDSKLEEEKNSNENNNDTETLNLDSKLDSEKGEKNDTSIEITEEKRDS